MNMLVAPQKLFTPEDLLALPEDGPTFELVDGQLVERPMSMRSGRISGQILILLGNHCNRHDAGAVYPGGEPGYQCFPNQPNKVRKPDVSFVRKDRLAAAEEPDGYSRIPPDLAVEVVSPNNLVADIDARLLDYLSVQVPLVWIVRPRCRMVEIHRADGTSSLLRDNEEITGEAVLPGFRCLVAEFFRNPGANGHPVP